MTTEYITRTKIIASEGMILTNGEVYGSIIFLSDYQSPYDFHEITEAEYQQILAEQEKAASLEYNHGA